MAPLTASAAGEKDGGSLTLHYLHPQASFRIYRVAEITAEEGYVLTEDFQPYSISLKLSTAEEWQAAAETLAGYVRRDQLVPNQVGSTDQAGTAAFSGLASGLYLVLGEATETEDRIDRPVPFLVALTAGEDITAEVKFDQEEIVKPVEKITVTAEKIWKDAGTESNRPESITPQLLRDGKVVATAELSEKNRWKAEWKDLDPDGLWQVVEETVPKGYSVAVTQERMSFRVVNTYLSIPATGDTAQPGLYGFVWLLSLAMVVILCLTMKKLRREA